jgi:hypothetical protein
MAQLELPGTASSNLVLPTSGLHDVVITWESDDEAVISTTGTVVIPLYSVGDQTVTLTAFLTLDGETLTKEFDVEVLAATEMTDQEKADEAALAFNGLISGSVIADVTLPTSGQYESTVAWVSSHPDLVTTDGVVTRPSDTVGNVVVTMTGTVTVGTATATVTLSFTVVAEEAATVYTSIQTMYDTAILDDYIEFTGIVTNVFDGGYFLSDGTLALGIYAGNNDLSPAIGDEVKVKGFYAVYNTLYQLGGLVSEEILSSGNANPLTPTVLTVAEILALDSSNPAIHGLYYTITGTVELQGTYDNIYLVADGAQVLIYYYSLEDSLAALEAQVGKEITITVTYYTNHGTNGPMVTYDGGVAGITVNTLPDADALAADIAAVEVLVPGVTLESIVLPTEGPNGTTFTGWASDMTGVLDNDGTFVALGATSTVVTFTATATKGELTETVTIEVLVPVLSTTAEVLAMDLGSYFQVSGTVYEISYYGFFIENNGAYLFVYGSDYIADVALGDNITFLGSTSIYSGLIQANPMGDLTINSQGNADVVPVIQGTVEGLQADLYPRGSRVEVTATVAREGSYLNVYIYGAAGGKVGVYYRSNDEALFASDGTTVTIVVVPYNNESVLYQGVEADVVASATFDDAAKAQAVADGLDLGDVAAVEMDLTLPTTFADPVATISWASDNEPVVGTDGVVSRVAGSDTTVTLTATVTVGAEVVTRVFVLTVIDANNSVPLTVSEALLEADGTSVLVKGVVVGSYYNERVIQDSTGAAIYLDSNVYDVELGDEIVVRGTLGLNTSYGDNQRDLNSVSYIETLSTGNALILSTETDPAVIRTEFASMFRYTATLTITSLDDGHGYVLFNTDASDINGFKFKISTEFPEFAALGLVVGDTMDLTFTACDIDFDNLRIVSVEFALTDAQKVLAAVAAADVSGSTTTDLTLLTESYGVAIAWASDNAAITDMGVVTRPANGDGDATVTLTATFTLNAETATETFTVVVPELAPPAATLFFSEYIEGSSNNKAVEIYNPNAFDVVMTGYKVCLYSNGATECGNNLVLDGITIAANSVYVITNSSANAEIAAASDVTSSITYFNGDDTVTLELDGTVVDIIGLIGEDPASGSWPAGTAGSTVNFTLVRNSNVTTGNTVFTAAEWTEYATDTATDLGTHTVD